jgi:hypothetical protein
MFLTACASLLLLALPGGAAADTHRRATAALKAKNHKLRIELRKARREATTLRAQVGDLTASLTTRTAERDQANTQLTALRRQIASQPSALTQAIEHVRREVVYSELTLQRAGQSYSHGAIVAHAAMSYVVGHVSAPAYGYMNGLLGTRPKATANDVLDKGAGICGHAALTYAAIVKAFGLKVRSVQFYYADGVNNHITDEVHYDGAWHYYDPTWGAFYEDESGHVLSITEARGHPDPQSLLRKDETLLWGWVWDRAGGHPLGLETDPATRVELDRQPFSG